MDLQKQDPEERGAPVQTAPCCLCGEQEAIDRHGEFAESCPHGPRPGVQVGIEGATAALPTAAGAFAGAKRRFHERSAAPGELVAAWRQYDEAYRLFQRAHQAEAAEVPAGDLPGVTAPPFDTTDGSRGTW